MRMDDCVRAAGADAESRKHCRQYSLNFRTADRRSAVSSPGQVIVMSNRLIASSIVNCSSRSQLRSCISELLSGYRQFRASSRQAYSTHEAISHSEKRGNPRDISRYEPCCAKVDITDTYCRANVQFRPPSGIVRRRKRAVSVSSESSLVSVFVELGMISATS